VADEVQGLSVGSKAVFTKAVTAADIAKFAEVSGDTARLHSDPAFAARTRFKQPIAHGMLGAGIISAALGTKLAPDAVVIYLGQNLQFRAPVIAGDTLTATCTVTKVDTERNRLTLDTVVKKQDDTEVIRGEATVMVEALG